MMDDASDADRLTEADLIELARQRGAAEAMVIDPARVVVSEAVAIKCRYGCPEFGKWRTCPPHSPAPDQTRRLLAEYQRALLVCFRAELTSGRQTPIMKEPQRALAKLERDLMGRGAPRALALGMGRCWQCDACQLEPGPCLHPEVARPSMEACGIDVLTTVKNAGFAVSQWAEGDQAVDLVGMIFLG
jgi:predicted metal-binding protein